MKSASGSADGPPGRQGRRAAWLLLVLLAAAMAWRLATIDYGQRISTDVLDLIPGAESAPELALVRSLAGERQARAVLFALHPGAGGGPGGEEFARGAAAFLERLRAGPAFTQVLDLSGTDERDPAAAYVFEHRMQLLLPQWLEERAPLRTDGTADADWARGLAGRAVRELERFLQTPAAAAFAGVIPADPLLLLPRLVEQLPAVTAATALAPEGEASLIWAELAGSPLDGLVQARLFAAVNHATAALRAAAPAARVEWTSIARFATASRARITSELALLNTASLLAVLAVTGILLHRVRDVLHLLPVLLFATAGAWCTTLAFFQTLPVMVLVVGSLLAGVAIDYGFHLFGRSAAEAGLRGVLRPLLASALTTVVGFAVMWFSELPVIRAIGVFVTSGLVWALLGALLWYGCTGGVRLRVRPAASWSPLASGIGRRLRPAALGLLGLFALAALTGPWRLQWKDDIRELEVSSEELRANDLRVRRAFGETGSSRTFLSTGATLAEARLALEAFRTEMQARGLGEELVSLGLALPTPRAWQDFPARLESLRAFEDDFRAALAEADFDVEAFAPFFAAWHDLRQDVRLPSYSRLLTDLAGVLGGPTSLALQLRHPPYWFVASLSSPDPVQAPAGGSTIALDQLATLNRVFSHYREVTLRTSLWGALVASVVVLGFSGLRRGGRILLIPALSCLVTLGVFGFAGVTINLFHLLATLLAACLSFDYAIFAVESQRRGLPPPPSIRLSALTTAASFTVLAFSAIPVVSALGTTVALGVLVTLATLEALPLATGRAGVPR